MNIVALFKKVFEARMERQKQLSYWLAKVYRLAFLYIFKDEVLEFMKLATNWARENLTFLIVFRAITFVSIIVAIGIVVFALVDLLVNKESIDLLSDKIESILKKLDSLLEIKRANL